MKINKKDMTVLALNEGEVAKLTTERAKEAPKPFAQYITVTEFCILTGAERQHVYYSIREEELPVVKHGIYFIDIEVAQRLTASIRARALRTRQNTRPRKARVQAP